jgi:hypothetical protein
MNLVSCSPGLPNTLTTAKRTIGTFRPIFNMHQNYITLLCLTYILWNKISVYILDCSRNKCKISLNINYTHKVSFVSSMTLLHLQDVFLFCGCIHKPLRYLYLSMIQVCGRNKHHPQDLDKQKRRFYDRHIYFTFVIILTNFTKYLPGSDSIILFFVRLNL